ncbi:chaperonin 10-like protein [Apodospora peruviana]|uniref:Chaperonin 10-like protein n=1 Tax=Apodospora peruviana TaxID=516989 RepID=A0AAE0HWW3_9PEZI|nr:chaperonin 10-like protein [Apodospora peruviana]
MSLPKTYKHAVFRTKGAPLEITESELKLPGKGEILVKVEACGVCFSDVYAQNDGMGGGFPITPGHEIIGRVAAVGEDIQTWKVGERVGSGWHGGHDGTCEPCKKNWPHMCVNQIINGETKEGGYGEYVILRTEAVASVPESIDAAKYAPILCAGMTVFNSIRNMKIGVGELVAVQGLGGLGHLAIQYAAKFGYRVAAISRGDSKEKFVRDLGAHEYIDTSKIDAAEALQKLGGAALIVTTSPDGKSIAGLVGGLGILGKLLILSVPGEVTFNIGAMLHNGLSIQSWPSGNARDSEDAIKFTQLEGINCMVETFPLEKANDAYNAMLSGSVRFRAVITFP